MRDRYRRIGGRIQSPRVEINVVEHCNLACRSCSHLSPTLPVRSITPETVSAPLTHLSRWYQAGRVRLVGGEPLLHRDLPSVVAAIRESAVSDAIELVTNGLLLPRMSKPLWEALDAIEVSQYPNHSLSTEELERCTRLAARYRTRLRIRRVDTFRTSYVERENGDVELVRAIYRSCRVAHVWRCHTVANGRFYKCPHAYFLPKISGGNADADSVLLDHRDTLGSELAAYLESGDPLVACRNCLGSAGERFPHTQVARDDFRSYQERAAADVVDQRQLTPPPSAARVLFGRTRSTIERGVDHLRGPD